MIGQPLILHCLIQDGIAALGGSVLQSDVPVLIERSYVFQVRIL